MALRVKIGVNMNKMLVQSCTSLVLFIIFSRSQTILQWHQKRRRSVVGLLKCQDEFILHLSPTRFACRETAYSFLLHSKKRFPWPSPDEGVGGASQEQIFCAARLWKIIKKVTSSRKPMYMQIRIVMCNQTSQTVLAYIEQPYIDYSIYSTNSMGSIRECVSVFVKQYTHIECHTPRIRERLISSFLLTFNLSIMRCLTLWYV